jgi:glycerophosphoryl diester phosphodiesterase
LVIPHAGGDGLFPENTMYAYEQTVAMGGDVVDIDVYMSADGHLVAFHDATLERTTNGTGNVADMPLADLQKLDAGWTFERDGDHPFRGKGITIPTIESILKRFPSTLVTLDLKDQRADLVQPVCDLLTTLNRERDVYVGSDSGEQVLLFRKTCPAIRTSGTDDERKALRAARDANDLTFATKQLVSQPGLYASDGSRRVTEKSLAFSHAMGIAVLTWVVDDPNDMRELIDMGIDGIYTRRPDVLLKVLAERG